MKTIIDLVIVGLTLGLTYVLTSEGLWGAAVMFFNVLFAAMIAFNFYEPLATLIDSTGINWGFSDTLCLLGLFCITLVILRMTTETIAPAMVRFPMPVYHAGRLIFGFGAAALTMAVIILSYHTAPVHKKIFFTIVYDSKPPFGLGLDHLWLGFFQYETGAVFSRLGAGSRDPYRTYGQGGRVKVFDPRAEWLLVHQDSRPYGTETTLGGEEAAAEGGAAAGAGQGGQAAPGGRGGRGAAPGPPP
jgi:uncharacterized membrane protein required for colicin V production